MLGNFSYSNPTKLYFGEDSLCFLNEELPKYGKTVQLIYGGGSIKKNGIYNQVMRLLKDNGKVVVEDGGVMPNPTVEKLREGVQIARENHVDFLLAVGGALAATMQKRFPCLFTVTKIRGRNIISALRSRIVRLSLLAVY